MLIYTTTSSLSSNSIVNRFKVRLPVSNRHSPFSTGLGQINHFSGSVPLVAGAVAVYLEVYPNATVAEVQQALIDASTKNKIEDIYTWTRTPNRLLYTPDLPPPSIIISAESVYLGNSMLFAVNGAIPHKLVYWLMGDGSLVYGRSRFNYTYKTRGYKNVRLVAFDKDDAVGNAVTATAYKQVYVYGDEEAVLPPIYRLLLH